MPQLYGERTPARKRKRKPPVRTVSDAADRRTSPPARKRPRVDIETRRLAERRTTPNQRGIAAALAKGKREKVANAARRSRAVAQLQKSRHQLERKGALGSAVETKATQQLKKKVGQQRVRVAGLHPGGPETLLGKAARQFTEAVVYSPAGIYELGKAHGLDVRDVGSEALRRAGVPLKKRDPTPERTVKLAKQIGKQVVEDVRHPLRNPGYLAFDVAAGAAGGAGAVARVGAAGKAASAAGKVGKSRTRAALTRKTAEGGSLLRRPPPGRVQIAEGVHVNLSRNVAARQLQKRKLKAMKKRDAAVTAQRAERQAERAIRRRVGESPLPRPLRQRNLPERVGFERRRAERIREDLARAPAEALRKRAGGRVRGLSDVEQTAVRVVGEGVPTRERIAAHKATIQELRAMKPGPRRALARKRLKRKIKLLEGVEMRGYVTPAMEAAEGKLRETYKRSEASGARREAIIEEAGLMTRPQLEARKQGPGRVLQGATFERSPAVKAIKAHVREYPQPSKKIRRPRTEAEARTRLADLDKRYETLLRGIEEKLTGGIAADKTEVARRNLYNLRSKGKRRGRARMPTVKQEVRKMAEDELSKVLAAGRADPDVARIGKLLSERDRLRQAVENPERVFGAEKTPAGELGTVTETTPGGVIRRQVKGQEARPATKGLRGAEAFDKGRIYVPYVRSRLKATGRAQAGTARAIGIPRQQLVKGEFTGESLRLAMFRDDAVRQIADAELQAQRYRSVLRIREAAVKESLDANAYLELPDKTRAHYVPVRVSAKPYSADTRAFLDTMQGKLDEGVQLSRAERREFNRRADRAREELFPRLEEAEALAAAAKGEVRFVDSRRLGGLNEAQGVHGKLTGAVATVMDEITAAQQIAILFLKPAYLTPNLLGQTALTLIHQGPLAPWNMGAAVKLYRELSPEDKAMVRAGIGQGLANAQWVERGRLAKSTRDFLAHHYSKVLDSPFRWPAFLHEARALGYKTPADVRRLLNDPKLDGDRIEIFQRTRDAMVDYGQMSAKEQQWVRRVIFFYPWVKGSTLYGGRFLRDHPIQASVLAQLARDAEQRAAAELGPVPWYAKGQFKVGGSKEQPLIVDPRAAQLFGSPIDIAQAAKGLVTGEEEKGRRLADFLSPAAAFPGQVLYPHDPLQGYSLPSAREGLKRQFVEGLPQARLLKGIREPTAGKKDVLYPRSPGQAIAQYTVGGVFPHPVNRAELAERAAEESKGPPAQEAYRAVFKNRQELVDGFRRIGELGPKEKLPPEMREAWNLRAQRLRAYKVAEEKKGDDLEPVDRLRIVLQIVVAAKKATPKEASALLAQVKSWPEQKIESTKNSIIANELGGLILTNAGRALRAGGVEFKLSS